MRNMHIEETVMGMMPSNPWGERRKRARKRHSNREEKQQPRRVWDYESRRENFQKGWYKHLSSEYSYQQNLHRNRT